MKKSLCTQKIRTLSILPTVATIGSYILCDNRDASQPVSEILLAF
ncbi:hypothetical protein [Scytonema sp. UIC 10036]|nr:hypothetical protein [Scytonema sp. UIC 10036]